MHYQKEIWRGQHTLTLTEDAMTLRLLPELRREGGFTAMAGRGAAGQPGRSIPAAAAPICPFMRVMPPGSMMCFPPWEWRNFYGRESALRCRIMAGCGAVP